MTPKISADWWEVLELSRIDAEIDRLLDPKPLSRSECADMGLPVYESARDRARTSSPDYLAQVKAWRDAHPERVAEYHRRYAAKRREKEQARRELEWVLS